jgi:hypothetical protein
MMAFECYLKITDQKQPVLDSVKVMANSVAHIPSCEPLK